MRTGHLDGYLKVCISLKRKLVFTFWPLSFGVIDGLGSAICKPEKVSWAQGSYRVGQGELCIWVSTSQKQGDDQRGRKESHHLRSATSVPRSAWTCLREVLSGAPHFLGSPNLWYQRWAQMVNTPPAKSLTWVLVTTNIYQAHNACLVSGASQGFLHLVLSTP